MKYENHASYQFGECDMKKAVCEIIGTIMGVPPESVNETSSPETLSNWTSLNHMNLILALEQEFGVRFTDAQVVELLSVQAIMNALEERLSGKARTGGQ